MALDVLADIKRRLASGNYAPGPGRNPAGDVRWLVSTLELAREEIAELKDKLAAATEQRAAQEKVDNQCECCGQREGEREDRHGNLWCVPCHDSCDPGWSCQAPAS